MSARRLREPPRGAVALLRLVLPSGAVRNSILQELAYEHRQLAADRSRAAADRWY